MMITSILDNVHRLVVLSSTGFRKLDVSIIRRQGDVPTKFGLLEQVKSLILFQSFGPSFFKGPN